MGRRGRINVGARSDRDRSIVDLLSPVRELLARAPLLPTDNPQNVDFLSTRVGNYQYHPQWGVLLSQIWVR